MSLLPPELCREIFEAAAREALEERRYHDLLAMILVARRLRIWVAPYMYQIMMKVRDDRRFQFPASHAIDESGNDLRAEPLYPTYAKHVKHLLLRGIRTKDALSILEACVNVENVALWAIRDRISALRPVLGTLPIQRLSVTLQQLCALDPQDSMSFNGGRRCEIDPSLFPHLTHLDIFGMLTCAWAVWKPLAQLPRLTHLAVNKFDDGYFIEQLLEQSKTLQLVILLVDQYSPLPWDKLDHWRVDQGLGGRIVVLEDAPATRAEDWNMEVRGIKKDFWAQADDIKARKIDLYTQFMSLH